MILSVLATISYLLSIFIRFTASRATNPGNHQTGTVRQRWGFILVLSSAVILHAAVLRQSCCSYGEVNLTLGNLVSVISLFSALLLLVASLFRPTYGLIIVVAPIAIIGMFIGMYFPGNPFYLNQVSPHLQLHIAVAIPALGTFCIAFAQSLVIIFCEKQLRKPTSQMFSNAFPSLQTMDRNLFSLILLGFVLLSVNLIIGVLTNYSQYGEFLDLNHHVLLVILAWFGFAGLLLARQKFGWRGRPAAIWTISAFFVLALAYYGVRFVNEVLLGH